MENRELRYFPVELRTGADGRPHLSGLVVQYNRLSRNIGGFVERVKKGSFRSVLQRGDDVLCLHEHSTQRGVLGRTSSGTLQLRDGDDGLEFDVSLPDTTLGHDVEEMCRRGDLREMSYGFICGPKDSDWKDEDYDDEETDERCHGTVRTIKNYARVTDVSVVATPANFGTRVVVRSMFSGDIPEDVRRHIIVPDTKTVVSVNETEQRRARMLRLKSSLL
jgi:HK97 family phage prohead protease